jgi:tight adherence protein B
MASELAARIRIEPRSEFANILRVDDTFAAEGGAGPSHRLNRSFDRLVMTSGTGLLPTVVLRLCLLGAISVAGPIFVATDNLLSTAIAVIPGALLPIGALIVLRKRRQSLLVKQLPLLADDLARSARTGGSLPDCLAASAQRTPEPLRGQILIAVRRLQMGIGLEESLADLPERTGVAQLGLLATRLAICERSGCDLATAFEGLEPSLHRGIAIDG